MNSDKIVGKNIKAGDITSLAFSLYIELIKIDPLDLFIYERRLVNQQKVITARTTLISKLEDRVEELQVRYNKRWDYVNYPKGATYDDVVCLNERKISYYRIKIKKYKNEIRNIRRKMRITELNIESIL